MAFYVYQSSNTVYSFSGSCTDNSTISPTGTRTTYYLINGRWQPGSIQNIGTNNTSYICHSGNITDDYTLDLNYLVLPSVLIVGFFFTIILKWFFRGHYVQN